MISEATSSYATRIERGETVGFSFYYFNSDSNLFVNSLVKKVLERNDKIFLHHTLCSVLKELIINAVKANSKRYFFKSNNIDIENIEEYNRGMANFKDFIIDEQESVETMLKKLDLKVEIYLKKDDGDLKIYIRNNTPLLPAEISRIQKHIRKAKEYKDFTDIFTDDECDDTEGEGLGIILTLFFLKNSGIGEEAFAISSNEKVTQTVLTIPQILKPKEITNEIYSKILTNIEKIPPFPDNIIKLQELCQQPEADIKTIVDLVSTDIGLTTTLLRMSNSAGFIQRKKADSVSDAVKIIGMKNLSAIISASSARAIMDQQYSYYKEIWEHTNRVASYAREISVITGNQKITDRVFLASMLHDLGKIILLASSGDLGEWIDDFTERREVKSSTVIEEVSIGISHSSIGEKVCHKWNLPNYVSETIRCHHAPLTARSEFFDIVFITYLANEMANIDSRKSSFSHIESDILKIYGLTDENDFNIFFERVKKSYNDSKVEV